MQPHHVDHGKRQCADECGDKRAGGDFAERARALEKPGAGEASEHGKRRHHEDEMAQPVVERRVRQRREQNRKNRGERDQDIVGAQIDAADCARAAARIATIAPMTPSASMISGSLSANRRSR